LLYPYKQGDGAEALEVVASVKASCLGRAYDIWIATGHRDGEAEQHWLAAEREIRLCNPRPQ